jgi:hypothetical protein
MTRKATFFVDVGAEMFGGGADAAFGDAGLDVGVFLEIPWFIDLPLEGEAAFEIAVVDEVALGVAVAPGVDGAGDVGVCGKVTRFYRRGRRGRFFGGRRGTRRNSCRF